MTKEKQRKVSCHVRMNPNHLDYLKGLARLKSVEQNKMIYWTEMAREAIESAYPIQSTLDTTTNRAEKIA